MAARRNNQRTEVTREERFRMRNGDVETMFDIGLRYYDEGRYSHAQTYFKRAAANGSSPAHVQLGYMYVNGEGGRINYQRAFREYSQAFWIDTNREAQNGLGILYMEGLGVRQNIILARLWLVESAIRGCAEAAYNLGMFHESNEIRDALLAFEGDDMRMVIRHYRYSGNWTDTPLREVEEMLEGLHRDEIYLITAANWYQVALDLGAEGAQEALDRLVLLNIHPVIN